MKIEVAPQLNLIEVLRRAGYGQVVDRRATEKSWSRRMGSRIYPRFHVYVKNNVINLHLDQKQASYQGFNAHSGEYDGPIVEAEALRIIETANCILKESLEITDSNLSIKSKKNSFWGRIFDN